MLLLLLLLLETSSSVLLLLETSSSVLLLLLPLLLSGTGCYETVRRRQGVGSMCWNDHFPRSSRRIQRLRPDAVVDVVAVVSSFASFFVFLLSSSSSISFFHPFSRCRISTAGIPAANSTPTTFNLHGGGFDSSTVPFVPHLRAGKFLKGKNRSDVVSAVSLRSRRCGC